MLLVMKLNNLCEKVPFLLLLCLVCFQLCSCKFDEQLLFQLGNWERGVGRGGEERKTRLNYLFIFYRLYGLREITAYIVRGSV